MFFRLLVEANPFSVSIRKPDCRLPLPSEDHKAISSVSEETKKENSNSVQGHLSVLVESALAPKNTKLARGTTRGFEKARPQRRQRCRLASMQIET